MPNCYFKERLFKKKICDHPYEDTLKFVLLPQCDWIADFHILFT